MTAEQQAEAILRREAGLAEIRAILGDARQWLEAAPREDETADRDVLEMLRSLGERLHPRDVVAVGPSIEGILAVSRERRAA